VTRLVETEPGKWRVDRRGSPAARSALPMPHVISDEMPPTEQVDGRHYTSKAAFRAVGRSLGLIEIGNEKFKPKQRATADPKVKRQRRNAIEKAAAEYRMGRRAATPRAG
jgi:hypothetical protein